MRAHVELTPGEKKLFVTLTAEERQEVVAQMMETVREEFEWVIAVERARTAAEAAPELVARAAPPPVPAKSGSQRFRWPSDAYAKR